MFLWVIVPPRVKYRLICYPFIKIVIINVKTLAYMEYCLYLCGVLIIKT